MHVRGCLDLAHERMRAITPSRITTHTHAIARANTGAPVAAAKTLHAEEDAPNITEARHGSLRTSSTAIPCDLHRKKWTW